MKRNTIICFIFAVALIFTSCANTNSEKVNSDLTTSTTVATTTTTTTTTTQSTTTTTTQATTKAETTTTAAKTTAKATTKKQTTTKKKTTKQKTTAKSTTKPKTTTATPKTCTNKNNHSIMCGNVGKWYASRSDFATAYQKYADELNEQLESGKLTTEEYFVISPYGYECWSCSYCSMWTGNYKYTEPTEHTHSWNAGVITTEPTCTSNGIKTYSCDGCEETYTEEIEATGH